MKVHVGNGEISVVQGDITEQDTDAIVNAANNHLWMGAGVAGAIKRKGGTQIEQEAMAQGPVEVGEAVITSAGSLKARHVIHAAVMGQDLHTDADLIRRSTESALTLAERHGLFSISFPALGTGVGGFSMHHSASLMIGTAIEFMPTASKLRDVRFVLFDAEATGIFEEELRRRFTAKSR